MCGINCLFDPQGRYPNKSDLVKLMNTAMVYRGPDDEGYYADDQIALGMRRLSIIDIQHGHQPIFNEDHSLVIVVNGEIYNYKELMSDLKSRGHQFSSASDAEVVLHLYEDYGPDCLHRLRGMFAFVIWDRTRKKLFAARDRVGIKPLYYSRQGGALWLSSELKTIVAAAKILPTLDPTAVYQFLLHGYPIDQRNTVVEQVKRILPGEYVTGDGESVQFHRYWTPKFGGDQGICDWTDRDLVNALDEAVALHLRSDVPVGILLSGGVDSSAIAAIAARSSHNYTAFCAGYQGDHAVDERSQAHATAKALGLPCEDIILDAAIYAESFHEMSQICDEPVGDPAAMPQWSLYQQTRQRGYKVLLSGIGGDEVFFGYPAWNHIGELSRTLPDAEYKKWIGIDRSLANQRVRMMLGEIAGGALAAATPAVDEPLYALRDLAPQGPDAMASVLFGSYLVHNGCLLADKLGMGCSLEVRVPFLDHILVEKVFGLPLSRRFDPAAPKVLLKHLLKGVIQEAVLRSPKRGFSPPIDYYDKLVACNSAQVLDGVLASSGLINRASMESIFHKHLVFPWLRSTRLRDVLGIPKSMTLLFRLIAFEKWHGSLRHRVIPS